MGRRAQPADATGPTDGLCQGTFFLAVGEERDADGSQGYALIEYATLEEARGAIAGANGAELLGQKVEVDFAFVRPPPDKHQRDERKAGRKGGEKTRYRSRSPTGREDKNGRDEEVE